MLIRLNQLDYAGHLSPQSLHVPTFNHVQQVGQYIVTLCTCEYEGLDIIISIKSIYAKGYPVIIINRITEQPLPLILTNTMLPSSFISNLKLILDAIDTEQYNFSETFREFYKELKKIAQTI